MLIGYKDIAEFIGVSDPRTVKKYIQNEHLPVVTIRGRPVTSSNLIESWLTERVRIVSASTA